MVKASDGLQLNEEGYIRLSDKYRVKFESLNMTIEKYVERQKTDKVTKKITKFRAWVTQIGYYTNSHSLLMKINMARIKDVFGDFTKLAESEIEMKKLINKMNNMVITGNERTVVITKYVRIQEVVEKVIGKGKNPKTTYKPIGNRVDVQTKREETQPSPNKKETKPVERKSKPKEKTSIKFPIKKKPVSQIPDLKILTLLMICFKLVIR